MEVPNSWKVWVHSSHWTDLVFLPLTRRGRLRTQGPKSSSHPNFVPKRTLNCLTLGRMSKFCVRKTIEGIVQAAIGNLGLQGVLELPLVFSVWPSVGDLSRAKGKFIAIP